MSRTNIDLDDRALKEAMKQTRIKTKREVVNFALVELVKRGRRKRMLDLEGKVRWEGDLDRMRSGHA